MFDGNSAGECAHFASFKNDNPVEGRMSPRLFVDLGGSSFSCERGDACCLLLAAACAFALVCSLFHRLRCPRSTRRLKSLINHASPLPTHTPHTNAQNAAVGGGGSAACGGAIYPFRPTVIGGMRGTGLVKAVNYTRPSQLEVFNDYMYVRP